MDTEIESNEYIDTVDALARIGGNTTLYKRLLGSFLEGNHYEVLCDAIQSGNLEESFHQAHTIKGISANLSLSKIASLTAELEHLLKDGADINSCLAELEQAFIATIEKIHEVMAD